MEAENYSLKRGSLPLQDAVDFTLATHLQVSEPPRCRSDFQFKDVYNCVGITEMDSRYDSKNGAKTKVLVLLTLFISAQMSLSGGL